MSQFRKDEIARNISRINDTLATFRQLAEQGDGVDKQLAPMIVGPLSALASLIGGIANDLNEINERLANPLPIVANRFGGYAEANGRGGGGGGTGETDPTSGTGGGPAKRPQ